MIRKTLLVISLLLLVGTVGLWVRSYYVLDAVHYTSRVVKLRLFELAGAGRISER